MTIYCYLTSHVPLIHSAVTIYWVPIITMHSQEYSPSPQEIQGLGHDPAATKNIWLLTGQRNKLPHFLVKFRKLDGHPQV